MKNTPKTSLPQTENIILMWSTHPPRKEEKVSPDTRARMIMNGMSMHSDINNEGRWDINLDYISSIVSAIIARAETDHVIEQKEVE